MGSESIICWNVRGLNSGAHHDVVRELVIEEHISLVCLQETKMHVITDYDILQVLGLGFEYFYLPASQTRGGILVAWHSSSWVVSNTSSRRFSVSLCVRAATGGPKWWMSIVYEPTAEVDKPAFLEELHSLRQVRNGPWVLCGDFNMIYRAHDKNNDRLDRRRMGQFRRFLNVTALKEIHLQGRLFKWSNERAHPTLKRIDRVFILWSGIASSRIMICVACLPFVLIMCHFSCALKPTSSLCEDSCFMRSGPSSQGFVTWSRMHGIAPCSLQALSDASTGFSETRHTFCGAGVTGSWVTSGCNWW
jgi:exonuclease III